MDVASNAAVTAVWHADLTEAERWFEILGDTLLRCGDDSPDWPTYLDHLRDVASGAGFASATVEAFGLFVDHYASDPMVVVIELADPGNASEILQIYDAALEEALRAAAKDVYDDPRQLAWVTDAQMAGLEALTDVRGDWTAWLPAQLDEWWPDWMSARPEDLVPWLDEWLPSLSSAPPLEPRDLHWVTSEQVAVLEAVGAARGHWTEWLPAQLDQWWSDWSTAPPEQLAPWLDEWLPALAPLDVFDAGALTWVSADQVTALESLTSARGDWRDWLPRQLTEWWPDWSSSEAETLGAWLTECLPTLVEADIPPIDSPAIESEPDDVIAGGVLDLGEEAHVEPLGTDDLEAERPDTEIDASTLAQGVIEAVVGEAAIDLEEFSDLSDDEFAALLGDALETELDSRAPDAGIA
jgi:hypothetical protein